MPRPPMPATSRHRHPVVRAPCGLPAPVYGWSFVTSRYRTFAEHIGEFRELPWHERLPAAVDWAIIAGRLEPAADRGVEDEAWRAIWQDDLGYPIRALPERPEVAILWSQSSEAHDGSPPSSSPARALPAEYDARS